ncbi:hypothetical protein IB238_11245 [Rhizobium sp. ARZ01]|uniref:DUF6680 family protein n=1 Tax=Rhizobium sp. ARZ01 TaxID=2769313 RepID=UPI00177CB956|nr:DUF6680 family protein [Rhizobium sp. ARZ01]MBD9373194.1 hypothetical protein [Rhizobium sp. ARZ01]
MIDLSNIDWAVVLATLVGPIVAVGITLWHQSRSSTIEGRRELFVTMMKTRRHPTNSEFVGALNLVPVHFYGDKNVMERYSDLMKTFDDAMWLNSEAVPRLVDQVETKVAYLLSEVSKAVGRPVEQLHVLRGAYAPQGWQDEEVAQKRMRDALSSVLSGERPVSVAVVYPPVPQREAVQSLEISQVD